MTSGGDMAKFGYYRQGQVNAVLIQEF